MVMTVVNMIQAYVASEQIGTSVRLVHRLEEGNKLVHACMIGPFYCMEGIEKDIEKVENYACNNIPAITIQNIMHGSKFDPNNINNINSSLCVINEVKEEHKEGNRMRYQTGREYYNVRSNGG